MRRHRFVSRKSKGDDIGTCFTHLVTEGMTIVVVMAIAGAVGRCRLTTAAKIIVVVIVKGMEKRKGEVKQRQLC